MQNRMSFHGGLEPGMHAAYRTLAGGNPQQAYFKTLQALASIDAADARAAKDAAQMAIYEDQLQGRQSFRPSLEGIELPPGITADLADALMRMNPKPNMNDWTQGLERYQKMDIRGQAVDALPGGDLGTVAALNAMADGHPVPAMFNESGGTLYGRYSGEHQATPVGESGIVANLAKATADHALADQRQYLGNSGAFLNVGTGDVIDPRPYTISGGDVLHRGTGEVQYAPPDRRASSTDTTNLRKYREMIELGVPEDIARGTAYGTIRQVTTGRGDIALVDVSSGEVLGTLEVPLTSRGSVRWIPNRPVPQVSEKSPSDMTDEELRQHLGL